MQELQEKLEGLEKELDEEQKKFFCLKSVRNFLLYYDQLIQYKSEVYELLVSYFNVMEEENYCIDKNKSTELASKYIFNIGRYYAVDLGFKNQMNLSFAIFWGIVTDLLLLIFGILDKLHYIPIVTIALIVYWFYLKKFYEEKNKVYGLRW